ncbi:MAG: MotA/TolQ/ExbB proton channel family protein [Alphaproteobacteria bacterium]|nr:MotA/TolQ/ExbB proton channel family protein [Alphaproteobacteria bacterium]MBN9591274.1 MotA/TolQ/ExbB proton channel family protein [Alphaproteobacteria bacterium]
MISKKLAIAAAFVLLSAGASASMAFAQDVTPPADQAAAPADPAAMPATAPDAANPNAMTAAPDAAAPAAAEPAGAPAPAAAPAAGEGGNPYGLYALWANGDFVIRGVIILLALMSIGTWYIFFMKYFEQAKMLSHSKIVDKKFWASANLNEGIETLPKGSVFRAVAESGVTASSGQGTGLVNLNDWIGMALTRQVEDANARLQGGVAFLASVGSTAPFVGLFGTVWGIYHALIAIGLAGQASIDKVAGPVGEALIATAIGLGAAVPAVLLYNFLVRRNRVVLEKIRGFASDLQTYLITRAK